MTTAYLAYNFYAGASEILENNVLVSENEMSAWKKTLNNEEIQSDFELAKAMNAAGDSVLKRISYHVAGDDFRLDE